MASITTEISNANKSNIICAGAPSLKISEKAVLDNLTSNSNCGMIIGKPSIAISDACCIAFDAIAANKVNTRLRPMDPIRLIPRNCQNELVGFPKKAVYKIKLMIFITIINMPLYEILERIKTTGLVVE